MQTLRRTLDSRGMQHVRIIAADLLPSSAWTIADDMLKDPELFNAVDVIGSVALQSLLTNVKYDICIHLSRSKGRCSPIGSRSIGWEVFLSLGII